MAKTNHPIPVEHVVPILYADQPASLALGPMVSRLTFGVEDSGDYPRPVFTLAIPTVALLELVKDLSKTFDSEDFKRDMAKGLERSVKSFAAGTAEVSTNEFVKVAASRKLTVSPKTKN